MTRQVAITERRVAALNPAEAYDVAAPYYDQWKWQCFWESAELPLILSEVAAFVKQRQVGATLLDVGCGTGKYLRHLSPHFEASIGVDISRRMLAIAAERAPDQKLARAEATDLPFPSISADVVISTRMLSHVADLRSAIGEMARILRPGGLLILSDVAAEHDYEHTRLPLRDGCVYVQTFKHPFTHHASVAEDLGLELVRMIPITDEQHRDACASLGLRAKGKLGWVAIWRSN